MRFIDQFHVLLLDLNGTFMFNSDRLSEAERFGLTYRQLGGHTLNDDEVQGLILAVVDMMGKIYADPRASQHFPSVRSCVEQIATPQGLPEREVRLLERVIAQHEVGVIPPASAAVLRRLAQTHRLGIVSDIWSTSELYLQELQRAGIRALFDVIVFSSDYGCVKPSPSLFIKAMEALAVDRTQIVFVGDSLKRDIAGAKAAGLAAIWINRGVRTGDKGVSSPDLVIQDVRDLVEQ
ncbi:MAG TPA: HAD family hydrolase [Candidatus Binatia bacterium]|nr:HAD family hydrolase [Candidatus Binatia bacterium]